MNTSKLEQLSEDLRNEQTYLGSSREACGNGGAERWDCYDRAIEFIDAHKLSIEEHYHALMAIRMLEDKCGTAGQMLSQHLSTLMTRIIPGFNEI